MIRSLCNTCLFIFKFCQLFNVAPHTFTLVLTVAPHILDPVNISTAYTWFDSDISYLTVVFPSSKWQPLQWQLGPPPRKDPEVRLSLRDFYPKISQPLKPKFQHSPTTSVLWRGTLRVRVWCRGWTRKEEGAEGASAGGLKFSPKMATFFCSQNMSITLASSATCNRGLHANQGHSNGAGNRDVQLCRRDPRVRSWEKNRNTTREAFLQKSVRCPGATFL